MNSNWFELLPGASGRSEDVIIIVIDIRGFSNFCQKEDDKNIATYITKIYKKILEDYFPSITFSKPLGDGLLLVQKYVEKTAKETVITLVDSCLNLIDQFHNMINDDVMIIFDTPSKVGIGFVRGAACCIYNGDIIIDYSGKRLNYAARLMDKARPSGMVIDYTSVKGILPPEQIEQFDEDAIYLRGVAEKEPIKILYQKNSVTIKKLDRRPINEPEWQKEPWQFTVKEINSFGDVYIFSINNELTNIESISIIVEIPYYLDGKKSMKIANIATYKKDDKDLVYNKEGVFNKIVLNIKDIKAQLKKDGIPEEDVVDFLIQYY